MKVKYFLILVNLLILCGVIHQCNAIPQLYKYKIFKATSNSDAFTSTGCLGQVYLVLDNVNGQIQSIINPLSPLYPVTFNVLKIEGSKQLVEIFISPISYGINNIPSLTITDSIGPNTIVIQDQITCPSPHSELKPIYEPVLDFNLEDSNIYIGFNIIEDTYRAKMSCDSNVGSCSIKQGAEAPDRIEIVISPDLYIPTNPISLSIYNIKNVKVFGKTINYPFKVDDATYTRLFTPSYFYFNYPITSKGVYSLYPFSIEGDIGQSWSVGHNRIAVPIVPVLGNEHSQIGFGRTELTRSSGDIGFYSRNVDGWQQFHRIGFPIPYFKRPFPLMFLTDSQFILDTPNNVIFYSSKIWNHNNFTTTSFSLINSQDYQNLISLPFPYGCSKASNSMHVFSPLQLFSGSKFTHGMIIFNNIFNTDQSWDVTYPIQSPILSFGTHQFNYEFKEKTLIGNTMVIKIRFINLEFGVFSYSVAFNSQEYKFYAFDTLISGNFNDGIYEFSISTLDYSNQMIITISDFHGQTNKIDELSLDFELQTYPVKIQENHLQIDDIKSFFFSSNVYDTSLYERKGSVFFSLKDTKKDHITSIVIVQDSSRTAFTGIFIESLQMYRIDFNLNFKMSEPYLQYVLNIGGISFQSHHLRSKFGNNAILKLVRNDIDNYPPMITKLEYLNNASEVTLTTSSPDTYIGWRLTITDRPNGFKYGNITIKSTYDSYPTSFVFDESNKIEGDQYQAVYEIKFKVHPKIQSQTYVITNVYLEDNFGKYSVSPYAGSQTSGFKIIFSPFYELGSDKSDIKLITPINDLKSTIPTITGFTAVAGTNNEYTFTVKTQDSDPLNNGTPLSGINQNRPPVIFVQSYQGLYQNFTTKFISKVGQIYTFEIVAQIDPKLTYYGCHVSVYGIYNNDLAIQGYSSIDLKTLGYTYFIKITSLATGDPIIESTNMITQFGGPLTITGKRFKGNPQVFLNNQVVVPVILSTTIIVINVPPMVNTFNIKVSTSNVVSVTPILISHSNAIYVDPTSTCTTSCGTFDQPFKNIISAIQVSDPNNAIILKDGVYKGLENTELVLDDGKPLDIRSFNGNAKVIIDCDRYSYFMKLSNSVMFSFSDITIKNCMSNRGGAFYIENSDTIFSNVQFINNQATNGGAIYSYQSKVILTNVLFKDNKVLKNGAAIYSYLSEVVVTGDSTFKDNQNIDSLQNRDILCQNSTIDINNGAFADDAVFKCLDSCDASYAHRSLCHDVAHKADTPTEAPKCSDGKCTGAESCLNCPNDCSCYFNGMVQEIYQPGCSIFSFLSEDYKNIFKEKQSSSCTSYRNTTLPQVQIENFLGGRDNIVIRLFGYVSVESSKTLPFIFHGSNFGLIFKVDGLEQMYFNQNTKFNETQLVYLTDKHVHFIEIILFSNEDDGSDRSFNLVPFNDPSIKLFFSNLICNDGILNENELRNQTNSLLPNYYCPTDHKYPQFKGKPFCGDGICNEKDQSNCFKDCYSEYTKTCAARTVPDKHISPGFYYSYDTLGDMISNQFIWRLPGSEHLSFGMNIVTGEEAPSPLFQFDYCQDMTTNVIEDPYRGNVYQIPPEFSGKSYPQCTFSTITESFSSTAEMAQSQEKSASLNFEADVKAGGRFISGGGSAAFSLEKSSKESSKMKTSVSQTIFKTDLVCKTTFVEMDLDRVSLHPNVLNELSNVKDTLDMVELIKKHGTHFYKKTFLGGKLSQLTVTSASDASSDTNGEWSESASASLSASVNGPSFSVDTSVSASIDKSQSTSKQQEKSDSSSISRLLVYGGAPAAFSPSQDKSSGPGFMEWAQSIDVLPIPIDYQLYPIRYVINKNWVNKHGVKLQETWENAEQMFYAMHNIDEDVNGTPYTLIFKWSAPENIVLKTYPTLKISYSVKDGKQENGDDKYKTLVFSTPIILTFTNYNGEKTKELYSHSNALKTEYCSTQNAFYQFTSNGVRTQYMSCHFQFDANMRFPVKFDFRAPDFFKSPQKPQIKIITPPDGPTIDYTEAAKIISWSESTAVLFNQNGVISSKDKFYAITHFESKWASYWNRLNYGTYPNHDFGTSGLYLDANKNLLCDPIKSSSGCNDGIQFSYRGPRTTVSSTNTREIAKTTVSWDRLSTFSIYYNKDWRLNNTFWHSFSAPVPVDSTWPRDVIYIQNLNRIGLLTRINWLKIFYPSDNIEKNWKFIVYAYHIKKNQKPQKIREWLSVNDETLNPEAIAEKFFDLNLLSFSEPKQLFTYFNYNNKGYDLKFSTPDNTDYPYYENIYTKNNEGKYPVFVEDGQSFTYY